MELSIETIYADGTGNIGISSHEPDNNFYIYRLNDELINDNQTIPNTSDFYPFKIPEKEVAPSITTLDVDEFGVKNSIGWGAGAFYHPTDSEYSHVVLPIHHNIKLGYPPEVEATVTGKNITFKITSNSYECARMIAEQNNIKIEQVEYFKKGTITYEMTTSFTGTVNVWVQAYSNEINNVSEMVYLNLEVQ